MMMSNMVQLGATLPDNSKGAILTLSRAPCNNPAAPGACCNAKGTICAAWAGAHLVSAGCIQYGVLELEASFAMVRRPHRLLRGDAPALTHCARRAQHESPRIPAPSTLRRCTLSTAVRGRRRRGPRARVSCGLRTLFSRLLCLFCSERPGVE